MDIFQFIWPEFPAIPGIEFDLARTDDADGIGKLSKSLIEQGLPGWAWNPNRVASAIKSSDFLVLVGRARSKMVAFAVMQFGKKDANLSLLAVAKEFQRSGTGSCLVRFLENSAFLMGNSRVRLEVRSHNESALAFYESLGYRRTETLNRYYSNKETAIRMSRNLQIKPSVEYSFNRED
jgi:[ribosomal protein S18]-alanine N-acetyltransferase